MAITTTADLVESLAPHLRVLRVTEAAWEQTTQASVASGSPLLISVNYDDTDDVEYKVEIATNNQLLSQSGTNFVTAHTNQLTQFVSQTGGFFRIIDDQLTLTTTDKNAGAIDYQYTPNRTTGKVELTGRTGHLAAMRAQMITDSVKIKENIVTVGALTSFAGNTGSLVSSVALTPDDHTLSGDIVLEVTNARLPNMEFTVSLDLADKLIDGTDIVTADNVLRPGAPFDDGPIGITTLQVNLSSASITGGDDGAMFSGVSITASTVNDNDSTNGEFGVTVVRVSSATVPVGWQIQAFQNKDSRTVKVFDSEDTTGNSPTGSSGAESKTYVLSGGTSWSFNFSKTAATVKLPVTGDSDADISVGIGAPILGDRWKFAIVNDEAGNFASKIAHRFRASLNSTTSGGETVSDALAASVSFS